MSFVELTIILIIEGVLMIASFLIGKGSKSPVQVIKEKVVETKIKKEADKRNKEKTKELEDIFKKIDEYDGR